ncbi:hypothetical protein C7382_11352 [Porphyromonas loveana]|uniref:Uncharacterized protein n=1 Tax=Porphyromonas loveana TaxID=1884669 RepID=A0A2U1F8A1_9PORP|nr:hypothetical protein C7382_11352 [Porphyromonas loveana]
MFSDRIMALTLTIKCMKRDVSITYIFHRTSRPLRAARFVFEQDGLLFVFEPTITKRLSEAGSLLSAFNE